MIPIKLPHEVKKMRVACETAAQILERVAALVQPGVSTRELDQAAAEFIAEHECRSAFLGYRNFPGNLCVSVNDEVVHGIGGPRRVQYGDIVKLDVGVVKGGWVGDTAVTVPVGAIPADTVRLLDTTQRALETAITLVRPGTRLGDVCAAIEAEVVKAGMSVVRDFVGHGVGRKLHEDPQIPNYGKPGTGPKLKPGMTLAIEPMVNLGGPTVRLLEDGWTVVTVDRSPSAHFEHTVLVTTGDAEVLTWREKRTSMSRAV